MLFSLQPSSPCKDVYQRFLRFKRFSSTFYSLLPNRLHMGIKNDKSRQAGFLLSTPSPRYLQLRPGHFRNLNIGTEGPLRNSELLVYSPFQIYCARNSIHLSQRP